MRILMLSQFYPPIIGGEEQHVRTLSIKLASRGHDVAIVTLWHEGLVEFELDEGVRVYRVRSSAQVAPHLFKDSKRPYAPPFPDPPVTLALRRIIARERPEIVHAHNWLVHSFLPLKGWSGARLVVSLHNYGMVCATTTLLYNGTLCEGSALGKCLGCAAQFYGAAKGASIVVANRVMDPIRRATVDMFLPVSQAVAAGNGLEQRKAPFQVMHNFIPDDVAATQGDIESYLAQLPATGYLLFVGAFNRQKGVDVLLRAYAGLTDAPPLVLIGYETPEWPELRAHCPPNVSMLTNWPRAAVMEAWRSSALALLPSVGPESCPTAVLEAMAAGRPVVASRIGGLPELVADGETGLLVQPGSVAALQQAMAMLLADPASGRRMGQAALRKVVDFRASTIVPRIERVYEGLLQKMQRSEEQNPWDDSAGVLGVEHAAVSDTEFHVKSSR